METQNDYQKIWLEQVREELSRRYEASDIQNTMDDIQGT